MSISSILNPATPKTPGVLAPPPFLLLGALAAGLTLQVVKPRPLLAQPAVGYVTGGALIALGLTLSIAVVHRFRRAGTSVSPRRPSRQLVVSGPYRFSRNPDYLGQALLYAGVALVLNALWVLLAFVPALLLVRYAVIAREERYLESLFGDEYRRYRQRVRRWL